MRRFFAELGAERAAKIATVTIDMSGAYKTAVAEAVPRAHIAFGRLHVQRAALGPYFLRAHSSPA